MRDSASSSWPTATPMQTRDGWSAAELDEARAKATGRWTTPQAHDTTARGKGNRKNPKAGNACLATDAIMWPTPMAGTPAQNGNNAADNSDFTRKAEALWKTPNLPSGGRTLRDGTTETGAALDGAKQQVDLANQAQRLWATPNAADGPKTTLRSKQGLNPQIATFRSPLPVRTTPPDGPPRLTPRQSWRRLYRWLRSTYGGATARRMVRSGRKRRLNPPFVEWLMGWPAGHALCDCSGTAFIHWRRRQRGALARLPMGFPPPIWIEAKPVTATQASFDFSMDEAIP